MDPDDLVDDEPLLDDELPDEDLDDIDDPEGGPQDGEDADQDDPEPAARSEQRKPRAQERITRLDAERKAEKERADRLQEELNRRAAGPQETPQELQRRREAHLASLTAEGRLEFLINESKAETRQAINQIQFATFDATDKAAFEGLCARNPAVARVANEVEEALAEMRKAGTNAPRETVVAYVLGKKALGAQPKARARGQRAAQEGRERQSGRPVSGRGDVAPNGSRRLNERDARRARLEDVKL